MKKFKKIKSLLFGISLTFAFCFISINVYAKTMTPDEIQGSSYVIGSHVFTREINETTGYKGRLTTNLIMLASQTIETKDLNTMIIYYKTASGMWINGLTGATIETPTSFEIDYTNLQLEEVNNTVSAPKPPILAFHNGVLSINKNTDEVSYQLDIYIDDIEDLSNKTSGVELALVDGGVIKHKDLKVGDDFLFTSTILDSYKSDNLIKGRKYHSDFITINLPIDKYYNITAKAYVLDSNGKKNYSDCVYASIEPETTLPAVEIINNYSNPDYITYNDNKYTYKLGIKRPDYYVFKVTPEKFAYIVHEKTEIGSNQIGVFGINEEFTVEIPKNSVKEYYAQLGYYNNEGRFIYFSTPDSEENRKYFTIDTRKTITTPILELDQREENYNYNRTYGDQVQADSRTYKNADKESLDYSVKGMEIYQIDYDGTNMSNFQYIAPLYGTGDSFMVNVKPLNGMANYVGRAYAINTIGEKVYSDYSNVVTVIRTPEIEVSDINDGKVNVSIKNLEEYGNAYDLKYKVFNSSGNELTELTSLDKVSSIDVDSTIQLYVKIYKESDETKKIYSAKSNKVDVTIK